MRRVKGVVVSTRRLCLGGDARSAAQRLVANTLRRAPCPLTPVPSPQLGASDESPPVVGRGARVELQLKRPNTTLDCGRVEPSRAVRARDTTLGPLGIAFVGKIASGWPLLGWVRHATYPLKAPEVRRHQTDSRRRRHPSSTRANNDCRLAQH